MKENKVYVLLQPLIVLGIIYLLYLLRDLWSGILGVTISILTPFIIGFVLAYACYPFIKMLERKKIPRIGALLILIAIIIAILVFIIFSLIPVVTEQIPSLVSSIVEFVKNLEKFFNTNLADFSDALKGISNTIINEAGKIVSSGTITIVNSSITIFSNAIIVIVSFIYFIFSMERIRENLKVLAMNQSEKFNKIIREIDTGMTNYFKGLLTCVIIQFFEYTIIFYLIGHPNFLLLGVICSVSAIIPYFGGIIANVIAVITASVVSPQLLVLTLIVAIVFPLIDGYVVSPKVYGKTNQLSSMVTIFAVFAGGIIYGFVGILIALPVAVIVQILFKNYKEELLTKTNLKGKTKTKKQPAK